MSVASTVALALAERVERTGGARAGLVAWKTLARGSDPEVRARATLAALRCAVLLRDEAALLELVAAWEKVDRGVWTSAIVALCKRLAKAGLGRRATELAAAEARRHRTARALYLHARCRELAGGPPEGLAEAFREAADRAANEGADAIELASRVRRLVILARSWPTMGEALAEAAAIDLTRLAPTARLPVCRVLLASPSRFVRAGALDALGVILGGEPDARRDGGAGDDDAVRLALELAARWVDEVGDALTALERDRVVALFGRPRAASVAPRASEAVLALARILRAGDESALDAALRDAERVEPALRASHARTRDVLDGRFEAEHDAAEAPTGLAAARALRHGELLDVVVGMREGSSRQAVARATRGLRSFADAASRGEPLLREVLGHAHAALVHEDAELRAVAVALFEAWLARPHPAGPPRGYLALADSLAALARDDLAGVARRAAVTMRESGAAESLGSMLARRGWDLARAGARDEAITALREARRLLVS